MSTTAQIHCLSTAVWPLSQFKPNPKNPNRHPDLQIIALAEVLVKSGWRNPIVVSKRSGFVVKGHGRLLAAQRAGLSEAPVDLQDYATEAEEMADMIADNRISELSQRDDGSVVALLESISKAGVETSVAGYSAEDFAALVKSCKADGGEERGSSRKVGGNILQYNVIFDSDTHQQQWFGLLKALKAKYPSIPTVGARIAAFITETATAAHA